MKKLIQAAVSVLNLKMDFFLKKDEFYRESCMWWRICKLQKSLYTIENDRLIWFKQLYNGQEVIFLLEIMENRFQAMQEKTNYNPRKCHSASKLSGCMQREQSKIVLALPMNNSIMEIFAKNISRWF